MSFTLDVRDVTVRGGFVGTETSLFERPPRGANLTILSGDLLGNDAGTVLSGIDNSRVILEISVGDGMLENLEFVGGGDVAVNASGSAGSPGGPTEFVVDGCVVRSSFGSGIRRVVSGSAAGGQTLRVLDSTFLDVQSFGLVHGGVSDDLVVSRSRFERCSPGVLLAGRWSPTSRIMNSVLRDCEGGVVFLPDFVEDRAMVQGCTIVGCAVGVTITPGFVPPTGQEILVRNSIVVGNGVDIGFGVSVEHSTTGAGASGVGVIDVDPQFVDLAGGDLTLLPTSPAIDRGTSDGVLPGELDGARRHRAVDTPSVPNVGVGSPDFVDLGAFEFTDSIGDNGDCTPEPNSTGAAGRLFAVGSAVVADNDLTLRGDQLPPGQFGIFVTGQQAGFTPMAGGLGTLCLSGPIGRFVGPGDILQVDAAGAVSFTVDLTSLPQPTTTVAV